MMATLDNAYDDYLCGSDIDDLAVNVLESKAEHTAGLHLTNLHWEERSR